MARGEKAKPGGGGRSWRDLQQKQRTSRKASTRVARKRRLKWFFRSLVLTLLVLAGAAGATGLYLLSQRTPVESVPAVTVSALELDFKTDGVLSASWFRDRFPDLFGVDVRAIDVSAVKASVEEVGQVASATVALELPSILRVRIFERNPILRVRVRNRSQGDLRLLVARDGTLYQGFGYPAETLRRLPGLTGLRVRELEDGTYAPLEQLEPVAELLETAKQVMPAVFHHWQLVDLSDWRPGERHQPSLIRIRSRQVEEIVFTTLDLREQLFRLAEILDHGQRYQAGLPTYVNLSFPEEAIIRYN